MKAFPSQVVSGAAAFGGVAALAAVFTVIGSLPEGEPTPDDLCMEYALIEFEGLGLDPSAGSTTEVTPREGSVRSWTVTGQAWSVSTGAPDRPFTCAIDDMDDVWHGSVDAD